jgi:ATPase subunit of ABC transporter with duplicated ATPase domains
VGAGAASGSGRPRRRRRLVDLAAAALTPLRALGAEVAATALALGERPEAAALDAYGALQAAFEARGGYAADRRLAEALDRVGLGAKAAQDAATASGGERRRARLAGALAAGVDLLLLDEPTNHLDLDARAWLAQRLAALPGALVFASHDRALIDAVATHVLVLGEPGPSRVRRGGWSDYARARAHAEAGTRRPPGCARGASPSSRRWRPSSARRGTAPRRCGGGVRSARRPVLRSVAEPARAAPGARIALDGGAAAAGRRGGALRAPDVGGGARRRGPHPARG